MKENIVQSKSFELAVEMIGVTRDLKRSQEYELAKQLIRSGTAVGANVEEAIAAESRREHHQIVGLAPPSTNFEL